MKQPIIFDVDTGIDDSLALLYLLASPEADILAITCTSGNVPARQVAINNLAWLELCRVEGIEVALGTEIPILAPLMTTEETHGPRESVTRSSPRRQPRSPSGTRRRSGSNSRRTARAKSSGWSLARSRTSPSRCESNRNCRVCLSALWSWAVPSTTPAICARLRIHRLQSARQTCFGCGALLPGISCDT